MKKSLQWRHNERDGVSNHQPHDCLLNRLFKPRSNKTSKLRVTGLCAGNSPVLVNSPHKVPITRKMFPFDDVIMGKNLMKMYHHVMPTAVSTYVTKCHCINYEGTGSGIFSNSCRYIQVSIHHWERIKTENHHDDNNWTWWHQRQSLRQLQCHQWRQNWHHDDSKFQVTVCNICCKY